MSQPEIPLPSSFDPTNPIHALYTASDLERDLQNAPYLEPEDVAEHWATSLTEDGGIEEARGIFKTHILDSYDYDISRNPARANQKVQRRLRLLTTLQDTEDPAHIPARQYGGELVRLVWKEAYKLNDDYDKAREHEAAQARLLREAMQQRDRAEHDTLTGLYGRYAWMARTEERAMAGRPMAILIIDIDRFKAVNDTRGHERGDDVLVCIAQTLARKTRPTDLVAHLGVEGEAESDFYRGTPEILVGRLGGDEFAVALDLTPQDLGVESPGAETPRRRKKQLTLEERAAGYANRMTRLAEEFVDQPENADLAELKVGLSIGISVWDGTGTFDLREHLRNADTAMFLGKQAKKAEAVSKLPLIARRKIAAALKVLTHYGVQVDRRLLGLPDDLGVDE